MRVVPQVRLLDLDARELGLVLVEIRDLVLADRRLHGDRVERVGDPLVDLLREPRRRDLEHPGETLDDVVAPLLGRSPTQSFTAVPAMLSTIGFPLRSRIVPRGASIRIVRSWFPCAAARYVSPERTWSDQSRKNSTAKIASATTPRTPTRSARPGVSRYGASTLGSGGRKRVDAFRRSP